MPITLLDLATAARASGLAVSESAGWQARGHGPFTTSPVAIVCHHTAGAATGNSPSLAVVRDGRSDLEGPLSNLFLARDGSMTVVAAGVAYHAGAVRSSWQGNAYSIGIEAEATGTAPWPAVQYNAYVRLCRALADHYGIPYSRVLGHKEVCDPPGRKIDPNFDMAAFRAAIANTEEYSVTVESDVAQIKGDVSLLASQLYSGPDPTHPGWPTLTGGSPAGGRLTVVDYLRTQNAKTEAVLTAVAALAVKLDALRAVVAAIQVGGVDEDALAEAVAGELSQRLAG